MNYKFTKEKEQQICNEYFSDNKPSVATLGKKWNCNGTAIFKIIKKNDYNLRTNSEAHKKFTRNQELKICSEYFSENKPSTIILSRKYNCCSECIRKIIKRNGYNLRTYSIKFIKLQEQQICKEYFSKAKPSLIALAKKWNCDPETIRNIILRNGFVLRSMSEVKKIHTKKQEQQICDNYFSKEKPSTNDLAKKWNCTQVTIRDIIIRNGYVLRTSSEMQKDPKVRRKRGIRIKKALSDPKIRRKMYEANNSPEAIQQSLKNGFGVNCYYNSEFFPSLQERDCYIKLKELGFKVIHNFEGRFDFLVVLANNKKVVVEFHPFDFNLTDKQYYNRRRKLLDKYGYKNLKLIVIKDLKEIEKFEKVIK